MTRQRAKGLGISLDDTKRDSLGKPPFLLIQRKRGSWRRWASKGGDLETRSCSSQRVTATFPVLWRKFEVEDKIRVRKKNAVKKKEKQKQDTKALNPLGTQNYRRTIRRRIPNNHRMGRKLHSCIPSSHQIKKGMLYG